MGKLGQAEQVERLIETDSLLLGSQGVAAEPE